MPRRRHKPEEIVAKRRQVDVLVTDAIRTIHVSASSIQDFLVSDLLAGHIALIAASPNELRPFLESEQLKPHVSTAPT